MTAVTNAASAPSTLSCPVMKLRTKRGGARRRDAKRVVDYQHLSGASGAGTDADDRNFDGSRQRFAELARHTFDDEHRSAGLRERP